MNKRLFQLGSIILGAMIISSCARGIVVPQGLSSKLLDIKVNNTDTATVITFKTNNLPQYAAFATQSPPSITIDLASTDASNVSGSMNVNNGFVEKINVRQLGESTGYSSRIIIELNKPLAFQTSTDGNNIILNISKTEQQPVLPSEGLQLTTTAPLAGGEISPSVMPEALAPIGIQASPTTLPEAPLAGGEISPSVMPEALAPIGIQASPTTLPEAPLAGGEISPSVMPEALAPIGIQASPTTLPEAPQAISTKEIPLPESTASTQGVTEEGMKTTNENIPSPTPSPISPTQAPASITPQPAPVISNVPAQIAPPLVAPPAPPQKKTEKKEKIAMLVPSTPVAPEIKKLKILHNTIITPVPLIFKSNEAVLSKEAEECLKDVANYMLEHKNEKLVILGYSDAFGSEAYNKELSYYRTLWVKMALERYDVPSNRLIIKPMGITKKFGHTKGTYALNRRVELKLTK